MFLLQYLDALVKLPAADLPYKFMLQFFLFIDESLKATFVSLHTTETLWGVTAHYQLS